MSHSNSTSSRSYKISNLNDHFRRTRYGGRFVITEGVRNLGNHMVGLIFHKILTYNDFTKENDPYGEHDFGSFTVNGNKIFWKIDYYDKNLEFGSEDPADSNVTTRVLTVMLAGEY